MTLHFTLLHKMTNHIPNCYHDVRRRLAAGKIQLGKNSIGQLYIYNLVRWGILEDWLAQHDIFTTIRPHLFICWITLHLGEFQSVAIRKKNWTWTKICKIIELLRVSFLLNMCWSGWGWILVQNIYYYTMIIIIIILS